MPPCCDVITCPDALSQSGRSSLPCSEVALALYGVVRAAGRERGIPRGGAINVRRVVVVPQTTTRLSVSEGLPRPHHEDPNTHKAHSTLADIQSGRQSERDNTN